tara:strand:- start:87 stop:506 length:420 start_codon:yes stop_codon:yes gene_type:complete
MDKNYLDNSNSRQENLIIESEASFQTGVLLKMLDPFENYCRILNGFILTVHATHDAWCYFSINAQYLDGLTIEKLGSIECLYFQQFSNAVYSIFSRSNGFSLDEEINRSKESNTPEYFCDKSKGDWDLVYKSIIVPRAF